LASPDDNDVAIHNVCAQAALNHDHAAIDVEVLPGHALAGV
jgi:hypothetical protein